MMLNGRRRYGRDEGAEDNLPYAGLRSRLAIDD